MFSTYVKVNSTVTFCLQYETSDYELALPYFVHMLEVPFVSLAELPVGLGTDRVKFSHGGEDFPEATWSQIA